MKRKRKEYLVGVDKKIDQLRQSPFPSKEKLAATRKRLGKAFCKDFDAGMKRFAKESAKKRKSG